MAGSLILAVFALCLLGVYGLVRFNFLPMDVPQKRSYHTTPTPRGAGVAMGGSFLFLVGLLAFQGVISWQVALAFGGSTLMVAAMFLDDLASLHPGVRFLLQVAIALWGVFWLGGVPPLTFGFGFSPIDGGLLFSFLGVFVVVALANISNFMDGSDGLVASWAVLVCLSAGILAALTHDSGDGYMMLLLGLGACVSGFLFWNLPRARVFMGDVGSNFIGVMIGLLGIWSLNQSDISPAVWLILLSVFIGDTTATLWRRVVTGQQWWLSSNVHAYHRLQRHLKNDGLLLVLLCLVHIFIVFPLAFVAWMFTYISWVLAVGTLIFFLLVSLFLLRKA